MNPVRVAVMILLTLFPVLPTAGDTVIPLRGTEASETSGDGIAFDLPRLDGIGMNPDGTTIFNPLSYPPLPIDPAAPENPLPEGTEFEFGTLTYDEALLTGVGEESLPVTNEMFAFDFDSSYALALGLEIDVRPPEAAGSALTLLNIEGPGLTFRDGFPTTLDFTASVEWMPTLNGFSQALFPYTGTVEVVNGTFTWALSDEPEPWFITNGNRIEFSFDLVATVTALAPPAPPVIPIVRVSAVASGTEAIVEILFDETPNRAYQLESSHTLRELEWLPVGTVFSEGTVPDPQSFPVDPDQPAFFRVRALP